MSFHNVIPKKQRAIVLSGGGALGAYQVGVLKILARKLREEDEKNGNEKELLFDIIAGTSIGAMNGAVLMSEFLRTRNWKDAVTKLEKFWVEKEIGLASSPSQENLREEGWTSWYDESKSNPDAAPEETARRYYSVKHFFWKGAPRVQKYDKTRPDSKLFDNKGNQWFVHSSEPLKNTILRFAEFPIATSFVDKNNQKQPRFLIFSVDVTEGATVTFDSFTKPDDPRTSVYGENSEEKRHDTVFSFDHGISIEHVMASGMLPEFYDYQIIHGHKYWDGGLLSNTPFRELLQAHQKYWTQIVKSQSQEESGDIAIPDLEVYIVNLHPSRQSQSPADHDGVKDRQNDIVFGDRNSIYDEKQSNLVTDLTDFVIQMKNLVTEAISKVSREDVRNELKKEYDRILARTYTGDEFRGEPNYKSLLQGRFKLNKVVRIERSKYTNSIYGKIGDFTSRSIDELIKDGENDALDVLK